MNTEAMDKQTIRLTQKELVAWIMEHRNNFLDPPASLHFDYVLSKFSTAASGTSVEFSRDELRSILQDLTDCM